GRRGEGRRGEGRAEKEGRRRTREEEDAERVSGKKARERCSQDIADTSSKSQALTETGFAMSSFGFTAIDSAADNMESASLMFAISIMPRSTSRSRPSR